MIIIERQLFWPIATGLAAVHLTGKEVLDSDH